MLRPFRKRNAWSPAATCNEDAEIPFENILDCSRMAPGEQLVEVAEVEIELVVLGRPDRHHRLDTIGWAGVTALLQGRLADATQLLEAVVAEGRQTNDLNYLHAPIFLGWLGMLRGGAEQRRDRRSPDPAENVDHVAHHVPALVREPGRLRPAWLCWPPCEAGE